jgi:hypothetical protein
MPDPLSNLKKPGVNFARFKPNCVIDIHEFRHTFIPFQTNSYIIILMNPGKIILSLFSAALMITSFWLALKANKTVKTWATRKAFAQDMENKFHDFFEDFHKEYKNSNNENIHWDERVNL